MESNANKSVTVQDATFLLIHFYITQYLYNVEIHAIAKSVKHHFPRTYLSCNVSDLLDIHSCPQTSHANLIILYDDAANKSR